MMTEEDMKKLLSDEKNDYDVKVAALKRGYFTRQQAILDEYAKDNSKFEIGDIVESNDNIVKIDKIYGYYSHWGEKCYPVYSGLLLTKQMKPRKDGSRFSIYDDGREIKKLK